MNEYIIQPRPTLDVVLFIKEGVLTVSETHLKVNVGYNFTYRSNGPGYYDCLYLLLRLDEEVDETISRIIMGTASQYSFNRPVDFYLVSKHHPERILKFQVEA